jgi:hypothetical protein
LGTNPEGLLLLHSSGKGVVEKSTYQQIIKLSVISAFSIQDFYFQGQILIAVTTKNFQLPVTNYSTFDNPTP